MASKLPKPKTVELAKSSYQPIKAEQEEEFDIDVPGSTVRERMANLTVRLLSR